MKHLFVPYNIALLAKENNFNEECICTYCEGKLSRNPSHKMDSKPITKEPYTWNNLNVHNTIVCAPLYQQLIDWFSERHSIEIYSHKCEHGAYEVRVEKHRGREGYRIEFSATAAERHNALDISFIEAFKLI